MVRQVRYNVVGMSIFVGVPLAFYLTVGPVAAGWALLAMIVFQIVLHVLC